MSVMSSGEDLPPAATCGAIRARSLSLLCSANGLMYSPMPYAYDTTVVVYYAAILSAVLKEVKRASKRLHIQTKEWKPVTLIILTVFMKTVASRGET
jgi:hypothetical protein